MTDHVARTTAAAVPARPAFRRARAVAAWLHRRLTPFNVVAVLILCVGAPITVKRFTEGLAATTNLTDDTPWGLWIGFDVLCGVALAAGGFVIASAVHLFGLRDYRPLLRPAILTGFLGYFFVVVGLCFDLGRPWRLPYPMLVSFGVTSVMFLVGWHVALYLTVQFLEFCPAIFEWRRWRTLRKWAAWLTVGATVFGVVLSTLHQSALGALFLLAPGKVHPLWYSPYIPVLFFVSAVAAGLSMIVFESMLSHRIFRAQLVDHDPAHMDRLVLGLGRGAAVVLFTYFGLKWIALAHGQHWDLLLTPWGWWWLLEVLGFVLLPCLLYAHAVRIGSAGLVRGASVITILGIVLNRLNVSLITFRWDQPERYVPHWMEVAVTITIVTVGLLTFRWIVNRMPVLHDHPDFGPEACAPA
jgi:Ni/Fe-hydrogenase subunit HybB-like protein